MQKSFPIIWLSSKSRNLRATAFLHLLPAINEVEVLFPIHLTGYNLKVWRVGRKQTGSGSWDTRDTELLGFLLPPFCIPDCMLEKVATQQSQRQNKAPQSLFSPKDQKTGNPAWENFQVNNTTEKSVDLPTHEPAKSQWGSLLTGGD